MPHLEFIPAACIWLGRQSSYYRLVTNSLYLLVKDLNWTIQRTRQLTGIISKLYGSRYLVLYLSDSVDLIPLKYIRPIFILNVMPYALGEYVLLWPHYLDTILRKVCGYHTGTPWSGNTTWVCAGLVRVSCTGKDWHAKNIPNGGAMVQWVLVLYHRLDGEWAL